MRFTRFGIAQWTAVLLVWLTSGSALAAPPSNDVLADATTVTVPFSDVLDTTEATTDGDGALLNATCHGGALPFAHTDASVWYVIRGTDHDVDVAVNVLDSSYTAAVLVGTRSRGSLQAVNCGIGIVTFTVAAHTTYYVLVADDQFDGGGNGGLLNVSFTEIPSPMVDITVIHLGTVNVQTGVATVSGTYTCSNGDDIIVQVGATQQIGQFTIASGGSFFQFATCDGAPHSWSVDLSPTGGQFARGNLKTSISASTCGQFECTEVFSEQTVQLRDGPQ